MRRLELHIERQQELIDVPNAAPSPGITRKKTVCIAVPCVPRHLQSLRLVLHDIRNQSLLPNEVVVSLSQSSEEDGRALEQELRREFFDGDVKGNGQQHWPRLRIVASAEARSHSENNNRAASFCESDIVSWFDADDRCTRGAPKWPSWHSATSEGRAARPYTEAPLPKVAVYFDAQSWDRTTARSESSSPPPVLPPVLSQGLDHRSSETGTPGGRATRAMNKRRTRRRTRRRRSNKRGGRPISVALGRSCTIFTRAGRFAPTTPRPRSRRVLCARHVSVDRASCSAPGAAVEGRRRRPAFGEDAVVRRGSPGAGGAARRRGGGARRMTPYQPSWARPGGVSSVPASSSTAGPPPPHLGGGLGESPRCNNRRVLRHDTVPNCPPGTQPGYYVDESDWSSMQCLRPDERKRRRWLAVSTTSSRLKRICRSGRRRCTHQGFESK